MPSEQLASFKASVPSFMPIHLKISVNSSFQIVGQRATSGFYKRFETVLKILLGFVLMSPKAKTLHELRRSTTSIRHF